jgi:endonuclease/exonuclease/phosphatase family metal-dependent hydrolase
MPIGNADRAAAMSWPAIALGVALLAGGCAGALNYLDANGPRYMGQHAGDAPPGSDVHVVSFNIKTSEHIAEAIAILRTRAPLRDLDVLALQEMDAPGVQAIAEAMGLNYVYYPASRGRKNGRDMGEALLSPWPIEQSWKVPLPHLQRLSHRSRAAVAARIRIDGRAVRVYSVHFGSPMRMSPGRRRDQARAVLADALASVEPVVIAGDFNSKNVSRVFESAGFLWVTRDVGRTIGPFSYDHIVARGLTPAATNAAGVVREANEASDHRPVWARLHLRD